MHTNRMHTNRKLQKPKHTFYTLLKKKHFKGQFFTVRMAQKNGLEMSSIRRWVKEFKDLKLVEEEWAFSEKNNEVKRYFLTQDGKEYIEECLANHRMLVELDEEDDADMIAS